MSFTDKQVELLNGELDMRLTKTRRLYGEGGKELTYLPSHAAIRAANSIFGFDGWNRKVIEWRQIQEEQKESKGKTLWYVGYVGTVEVEVDGVTRQGCGFGQGTDSDLGQSHESAWKEMESDAMKRALMTFGDPFGLKLYDKDFLATLDKPAQRSPNTPAVRQGGKAVDPKAPHANQAASGTTEPTAPSATDDIKTRFSALLKEKGWDAKAPQFEGVGQLCEAYSWNPKAMVLKAAGEGCETVQAVYEFVQGAAEMARKEKMRKESGGE